MHSRHLLRVLKILMDHSLTGQFAHTHDVVGIVHTILLNGIHCRIDIAATTVEISSMHMDHQWLTRYLLGMYPCRISQPVMRMNDIKLLLTGYYSGNDREIINLFVQVPGITTCKFHTSQIIHMHIRKIGIDMVAERVIFFRCHLQQT